MTVKQRSKALLWEQRAMRQSCRAESTHCRCLPRARPPGPSAGEEAAEREGSTSGSGRGGGKEQALGLRGQGCD